MKVKIEIQNLKKKIIIFDGKKVCAIFLSKKKMFLDDSNNNTNNNHDDDEPIGEVELSTNLKALPRKSSTTSNNTNLVARKKQRDDEQQQQSQQQAMMNQSQSSSEETLSERKNSQVRFSVDQQQQQDNNNNNTSNTNKNETPKSVLKKSTKVVEKEASVVVENASETLQLTKKKDATKKGNTTPPNDSSPKRETTTSTSESETAHENENDDETEEIVTYEYGDLFAFEFLAVSRTGDAEVQNEKKLDATTTTTTATNAFSPWAWGVGREVTAATKTISSFSSATNEDGAMLDSTRKQTQQQQQLMHHHKRVIKLELWEVEGREDKLSKAERARLAELRRQIAQTSSELAQQETQKRALDDAMTGAQLSIAAIDSALAADFADVQDLLTKARRALSNLKMEHFAEMRNYAKPPVTVRQVLECVLIALGEVASNNNNNTSSLSNNNNGKETSASTIVSWEQVKTAVRREDFVLSIRDFEPSQLSPGAIKVLQARLEDASFTYERAKTASFAAGPLHQWITAQVECAKEARRSKAYHDLSKTNRAAPPALSVDRGRSAQTHSTHHKTQRLDFLSAF